MTARLLGALAALLIAGGLAFALEGAIHNGDRQAAGWAAVPDRSWGQLEDLPPNSPILLSVALAEPNDATGLAVYVRQVEDCDTVTRTDSDGRATTRTDCDWETAGRRQPSPLRVTTVEGVPLTVVYEVAALGGPQRVVSLGYRERVVGWGNGDALTVAGLSTDDASIVKALAVSSLDRAAWVEHQRSWPVVGRVFQLMLIAVGLGVAGLVLIGVRG